MWTIQGVFCGGRFGSNYYNYFTYFLASRVLFVHSIYGLSIMTDVICIVYIHHPYVLILVLTKTSGMIPGQLIHLPKPFISIMSSIPKDQVLNH